MLGLFLVRCLCAPLVLARGKKEWKRTWCWVSSWCAVFVLLWSSLEGRRSGRGHGVGSLTGAIFALLWSWGQCGRNSGREEVPFRGRVQELCESRGGRPGLSVLMSLTVSVDVKQH